MPVSKGSWPAAGIPKHSFLAHRVRRRAEWSRSPFGMRNDCLMSHTEPSTGYLPGETAKWRGSDEDCHARVYGQNMQTSKTRPCRETFARNGAGQDKRASRLYATGGKCASSVDGQDSIDLGSQFTDNHRIGRQVGYQWTEPLLPRLLDVGKHRRLEEVIRTTE